MRWFKNLFKRRSDYVPIITPEMREKGLEVRRMEAKIKTLETQLDQKMRLQELTQMATQFNGNESGSNKAEEMLLTMLLGAFTNKSQQQSSYSQSVTTPHYPTIPTEKQEENLKVAELILKKVPSNVIPLIQQISDENLLDIRNKVIELNTGK